MARRAIADDVGTGFGDGGQIPVPDVFSLPEGGMTRSKELA